MDRCEIIADRHEIELLFGVKTDARKRMTMRVERMDDEMVDPANLKTRPVPFVSRRQQGPPVAKPVARLDRGIRLTNRQVLVLASLARERERFAKLSLPASSKLAASLERERARFAKLKPNA